MEPQGTTTVMNVNVVGMGFGTGGKTTTTTNSDLGRRSSGFKEPLPPPKRASLLIQSFPNPGKGRSAHSCFIKAVKDTKRIVEIKSLRVVYIASNGNTIKIALELLWPATLDDIAIYTERPGKYYEPSWIPSLHCINGSRVTISESLIKCLVNDKTNYGLFHLYGEFIQSFSLDEYPFDKQIIEIDIESIFSKEECIFVPYKESYNVLRDGDISDTPFIFLENVYQIQQDYNISKLVAEFISSTKSDRSLLSIRIHIRRIWSPIVMKHALVALFLSLSSLCSFALDPESDASNRLLFLSLILICLTVVSGALNQQVQSSLSRYLTRCIIVVSFILITNAILYKIGLLALFDLPFAVVSLATTGFLHLYWYSNAGLILLRRSSIFRRCFSCCCYEKPQEYQVSSPIATPSLSLSTSKTNSSIINHQQYCITGNNMTLESETIEYGDPFISFSAKFMDYNMQDYE